MFAWRRRERENRRTHRRGRRRSFMINYIVRRIGYGV